MQQMKKAFSCCLGSPEEVQERPVPREVLMMFRSCPGAAAELSRVLCSSLQTCAVFGSWLSPLSRQWQFSIHLFS